MEKLFLRILQMSMAGAVVILAVLVMRLILQKAPRKYSYLLWSAAAFRLCVPVSLPSPLSLFRLLSRPTAAGKAALAPLGLTLAGTGAAEAAGNYVPAAPTGEAAAAAAPFPWLTLLAWVWLGVLAAFLLYGLAASLRLRRRLQTAIRLEGNVFRAEGIRSPFLLGFLRPRIYVPLELEGADLDCVLAHERCHLRRGDPWLRLLAWLIRCVHWFNPLCWLAYFLMGRDMELSCDEAVLTRLGDVRQEYSRSLLHISVRGRIPAAGPTPPAFGETGVSQRVRNVLRWKKARGWVTVCAVLLCVLFTAAWITDPMTSGLLAPELTVNPDGTLGTLRWGMTPEEILAADSRFEAREEGKYQDVFLVLEEASVLGHTGSVRLGFAPTIIDEELHRSRRGIPLLNQIIVTYPGEISLRDELTELFGEPVKHPLDYYSGPEIVDGKVRAPFKEEELPEEEWYWLSDETVLDLISLDLLRIGHPGRSDEWLQAGYCGSFVYWITVEVWESEEGTYTILGILGNAGPIQRFLEDEYARRTEGGQDGE